MPTIYSSPIKEMRENMAAVKKAMEIQKEGDRGQGMGGQGTKSKEQFGVWSSEFGDRKFFAHCWCTS
jgi:hypothetical protein